MLLAQLLAQSEPWLPGEQLREEHQAIGFYLSGHPLDDYMASLRRKGVLTLAELQERALQGPLVAKIAGTVAGRQERKSARGNRFAFVRLSDPTGLFEVTVFADTLESARDHLEAGVNVVLTVEAEAEADQLKLRARAVAPVESIAESGAGGCLRVHVAEEAAVRAVADLLERVRRQSGRGARGEVRLALMAPDLPGEVEMILGDNLPVAPSVKAALRSLPGVVAAEEV
jgi:DNA polymerase-3 subunit alpha